MKQKVIVKSGLAESMEKKNKSKVGYIVRYEVQSGFDGFIVDVDGREDWYYREQIRTVDTYVSRLQSIKRDLMQLDCLEINVDTAFEHICELEDKLKMLC